MNPLAATTQWTTGLFDCARDEETCWWGCFACWMLSARTTESFELGTSLKEIILFWSCAGVMVLLLLFGGGFGFLACGFIILALAYNRALIRKRIRERLTIGGDFIDDLVKHTCCPCCSICQEAREANERDTLVLDYCSGENLEEASGRSPESRASLDEGSNNDGFVAHLYAVSRTSKIVLGLWLFVALCSFFLLFAAGRGRNALVLLITFTQPFLILYFVYWRARRRNVSLDYVIKLFAVGFWFTTFQSVILEEIIQFLIALLIGPFIVAFAETDDSVPESNTSRVFLTSGLFRHLMGLCWSADCQEGRITGDHYNSFQYGIHETDTEDGVAENSEDDTMARKSMQQHIVIVIFSLFLMAFVVAAGVEETTKHFIVRCCRFPVPLSDPQSILVYLMAGALGFATAENIEYVFGTSTSPILGTSVFVGELLVLFVRVMMPIHVICSVIQAANLSKVLLGQQQMPLYMILLPAIVLHGTFDFSLFLFGALQFAYSINGIVMEVFSLVIAALLTIGGAIYAYVTFKKVENNYNSGWHSLNEDEDITNQL